MQGLFDLVRLVECINTFSISAPVLTSEMVHHIYGSFAVFVEGA